jgi:hypothetical protein
MNPGVRLVETRTRQGTVPPQISSLNAAAAGVNTLPTMAVAVSGRRQGRHCKARARGALPEGWRLLTPAGTEIGHS